MCRLDTTPLTRLFLSIGLVATPACDAGDDPALGDPTHATDDESETDLIDEDGDGDGQESGETEQEDEDDDSEGASEGDDDDDDDNDDDDDGDDDVGDGDGDETGDGDLTPPQLGELPPIGWCVDALGYVEDMCGSPESPCDAEFAAQCEEMGAVFLPGNEQSDAVPCGPLNPMAADCDEDFINACLEAGGYFHALLFDMYGGVLEGVCWLP